MSGVDGRRGRVLGLPADPDALGAEVDEAAKAGGDQVTGEAAALMIVLGAERFHGPTLVTGSYQHSA
nr:hypothetical protein [Egibacter rhizosphaerae]